MTKTAFILFTLFISTLTFAGNDGCNQSLNSIIGSKVKVPTELIYLDLENHLDYDINEFEQWILRLKGKAIKSMLDENGAFAKHLNKNESMTIEERKALAYAVEVRPLSQDNNIYIALFWSDENLNRSQMRTELHAYGGGDTKPGEIPSESALFLHESCEACRGLNLTGKSFMNFQKEIDNQNAALYAEEVAFFENVIKPLEKRHPDGNYNIISLNAKAASIDTLVHEGHHALYDTDEVYKKTLLAYWDKHIRDQEDDVINKSFRVSYSSYEILQDEFFAYLLQPKSFGQGNPMEKFKDKHLNPIIEELKSVGITPPFY